MSQVHDTSSRQDYSPQDRISALLAYERGHDLLRRAFDSAPSISARHEEWRYTNPKLFGLGSETSQWSMPKQHRSRQQEVGDLPSCVEIDESLAINRIVIDLNGQISRASSIPDGVRVMTVSEYIRSDIEKSAGVINDIPKSILDATSLSGSAFSDHALALSVPMLTSNYCIVHVSKNVQCKEPLLINICDASKVGDGDTGVRNPASHVQLVFHIESGAECSVVENNELSLENSFRAVSSYVFVGENARFDRMRIENGGPQAKRINFSWVKQAAHSRYSTADLLLSGKVLRQETQVQHLGEGCHTGLNGISLVGSGEHMDNRTRLDHLQPNCTSDEVYKTILSGDGKGVFNGKIYVHSRAQKTDAKQSNQSLLLSDNADMNAKPQLEIFADDVKCTHGATIGQLDAEGLYYLQCRGIDKQTANVMLTRAYIFELFEEICSGVSLSDLHRKKLSECIDQKVLSLLADGRIHDSIDHVQIDT